MPFSKRFYSGFLCSIFVVLVAGCGDSDEKQPDVSEAEKKLEEAQRLLDQAKTELEQAKAPEAQTAKVNEPVPPSFVPPPDHLEPFNKVFGFGDQNEVAHFWNWNHQWSFTDQQARNAKWNNYTFIASTYRLNGDFKLHIQGMMSKSYSNAKRPHLHVSGHQIKLFNNPWKHQLDMLVTRQGQQLTYVINGAEPVTIQLTEDQMGSSEVLLRFHNRHTTINRFELKAESADRQVE